MDDLQEDLNSFDPDIGDGRVLEEVTAFLDAMLNNMGVSLKDPTRETFFDGPTMRSDSWAKIYDPGVVVYMRAGYVEYSEKVWWL